MSKLKEKTCRGCSKKYAETIFHTLKVTYAVDGQTILESEKTLCPNCKYRITEELFETGMFPAKGKRAKYDPIPHHDRDGSPCRDCGASEGEYHLPGCDRETCPVCGHQLLSCGHGNQVRVPGDLRKDLEVGGRLMYRGWLIVREEEDVYLVFTPENADYPERGYEDWETGTLEAAKDWIENYPEEEENA